MLKTPPLLHFASEKKTCVAVRVLAYSVSCKVVTNSIVQNSKSKAKFRQPKTDDRKCYRNQKAPRNSKSILKKKTKQSIK